MLQIDEIHNDHQLDDLATEWDDLLGRCGHSTIFQSREWLGMCRRYFGRAKQLITLTVRDNGRLVGLAPLEITRIYGSHLRRLQFIGTGRSDYLSIITDHDSCPQVFQAVLEWCQNNLSRWDVVDLQAVPEGVWECGSVGVWVSPDSHSPIPPYSHAPTLLHQELCPYMPLGPTWEETIAPLGKKTRYNLGYYERLMRRQSEVEFGMIGEDQLDEGLDALFHLHTRRWRRRWMPGVLSGDRTRAFHRELAEAFLRRGWLRLHTLRLDGRIRAVLYCLTYGAKTMYYIGGFDPELSRFSTGTILTGYAIRQAIEDGCTEFDFLRGNEGYKARWTDRARMNGRIVIGRSGIRSAASSAICRLEMRFEHRAKEWMHRRFGGLAVKGER